MTFTIGLIQTSVAADKALTVDAAVSSIRDAAARGAQIICLQELFDAPYFCKVTDAERFDLAEPIPGPTTERMQALAKELAIVLIVPIFEKRAPGVYHNSAGVIDADGSLLGIYRKMHIPDDPLYHEKYYFTPGEIYDHDEKPGPATGFRVFKTKYATIGVLICWDQWYPEGARITAMKGANVLFYPTAIGWHPHEKEEFGPAQYEAWLTIQRAHAIANGVYVAAVNRVGHEHGDIRGNRADGPGLEFWGGSFLADPFGRVIARAAHDREQILIGEIDLAVMEDTRRNWPFLRDRRIDAYAPIVNRFLDDKE